MAASTTLPASAQTVTPSEAVWFTTTTGTAVSTFTVTQATPPPFTFAFTQPTSSGAYPASVNATLMDPLENLATYTYNGPIDQFSGLGAQGSTATAQQGYIVGPAFSASIAAGAGLWNTGTTFGPASATSLAGTPSLVAISSNGAPGANAGSEKHPGAGSCNAGAGGDVSINHNPTMLLSVANVSIPSGVNVTVTPWTPIGSAILATSQGGVG